ncbi:MAG TPA: flagellar biosynthesis anti-sigma factor FlgM [Clostridiales bacterium]|nr:flagellar biosynthesis anti-sigma factor FlgM [Clostridiales bacterium]
MKINGTNRIDYVNQAYKKNNEQAVSSYNKASGLYKSRDTIELSETSRELYKQIEKLSAEETVDSQKIDSIKQAIQNGTYRVSPKELAEKIINRILEQTNPGEE